MKKITIQDHQKNDFLNYAYEWMNKNGDVKNYKHVTQSILEKTFDFFYKNKLTVEDNAKSYWYNNRKLEMICYGYSGISANERDDIEGMIDNLYHEIFCKAEWVSRGLKEGYSNVCKAYFGKDYTTIVS